MSIFIPILLNRGQNPVESLPPVESLTREEIQAEAKLIRTFSIGINPRPLTDREVAILTLDEKFERDRLDAIERAVADRVRREAEAARSAALQRQNDLTARAVNICDNDNSNLAELPQLLRQMDDDHFFHQFSNRQLPSIDNVRRNRLIEIIGEEESRRPINSQ